MLRLLTLTAVLALAACANTGDEGMIVLNNTATADSCVLMGTAGQPFTSHGQIYAKSPNGYLLTPLIQSRVVKTDSVDVSQRTIFITGANVDLKVEDVQIQHADGSYSTGSASIPGDQAQFAALFSGSLPPEGTANVGFEVIRPQTLHAILTSSGATDTDKLSAEVLATVTILGKLNGDNVSATPFQYPVSVCTGCVVVDNGTCPMTVASPRTGNACNPYQDGMVDCCKDASGSLVCPGTTM